MKALTTKIVNHGTHGTHGTHGKNALPCVRCVPWFNSRQFRVIRGFIPLAGRERLLRSTGPWVPQDCSAEGPRESLEGSQPVSSH